MLQFITNENSSTSPSRQILDAIDGGCRWVQIRLKKASDEEIQKIFSEVRDKAKEHSVVIIINDRVELARQLGADGVSGVHLGKEDMVASEARLLLGPEAIIGITAHSFEEAVAFKGQDVDYIGIGPFAFTDTKSDLAPVLGLEGIADIMARVKDAGIEIPCVAVGGIKADDVAPLLAVGVNGVAVSGAIANSEDIKEATRLFIKELPIDE